MLTFFRRIRKNLIGQTGSVSPTMRYLFYAIGEIVLVVAGILIALQINNWNQDKQNRIQEQQILRQLHTEYSSNLQQINQKISLRNYQIQSCLALLSYRQQSVREVNVDSFNLHLSRMILRPTYDPELGVTTELTNSGQLYLISNDSLRNQVSAFTSFLGEVREEEMVIFNNTEHRIIPFLFEHYQIGIVMVAGLEDNDFSMMHKLSISAQKVSFSELVDQVDISDLLYHPTFEDHLTTMISNVYYTNDQSEGVRMKIEAIIDLLEREMEE